MAEKLQRGRYYVGDVLITERFYKDSEDDQQWLEYYKSEAANSPHPDVRYEVVTFEQVGEIEVILPVNYKER